MGANTKIYNRIGGILIFIGLPLLTWFTGDFPQRTVLKEFISILTILAFFLMLMQFFLARSNRKMLKDHKMSKLINFHKVIGYIFVSVLLVHPILIVVPRYFESGIEPTEALIALITTFNSKGVVLGIIAWSLMLLIGITSMFRNKIGMNYKTWRVFHGILSILFISIACWHILDMGRHINLYMSVLIIVIATSGVVLLLKTYFVNTTKRRSYND